MTTPCELDPTAYDQPGEDPAWHLLPRHKAALAACHQLCPRPLDECARDALTSGTIAGQSMPRVASGVIQAGVVCRGDLATHQQLVDLAYPNGDGPTYIDLDAAATECGECDRVFVPADEPIDTPEKQARRAVKHQPLCRACYKAAWRSGRLSPALAPTPAECVSCHEPMSTRYTPLPGHVTHESNGRCTTCVRAATRAQEAAA